jgi:hypothetical protein
MLRTTPDAEPPKPILSPFLSFPRSATLTVKISSVEL